MRILGVGVGYCPASPADIKLCTFVRSSQFTDSDLRQNLMERTLPVESACGHAVMETGLDKSTLILIKHCRDMKQQETCLRLITLLLVLSSTVLFYFASSVILKQNTGPGGTKVSSTTLFLYLCVRTSSINMKIT